LAGLDDFYKDKIKKFRSSIVTSSLDASPKLVGKIIFRGINNDNKVYMGPFGGLFYMSRITGVKTFLKTGQNVQFLSFFAFLFDLLILLTINFVSINHGS
jgi:hypothetical protein